MSMTLSIIAAFFAGGVSSAIGGLGAVVLTALTGFAGVVGNLCGAPFDIISNITFGPIFGPHVGFAAACPALMYAWKMGWVDDSRGIAIPLISTGKPSVLLVGGVFGIVGHLLNVGIATLLPGMVDSVALALVIVCMLGRIIFGGGFKNFLGETSPEVKKVGRFSLKSPAVWNPNMTTGPQMFAMGILTSGVGGMMTYAFLSAADGPTHPAFGVANLLPWCIAVTMFVFAIAGLPIAAWHHMAMCASVAVSGIWLANGHTVALTDIIWMLGMGVIACIIGDWSARLLMCSGEGFVDPPSMAIVVGTVLSFIFSSIGAYNRSSPLYFVIPIILIALGLVLALYHQMKVLPGLKESEAK